VKIIYEDEYGEELMTGDSQVFLPLINDVVIINSEEWFVRSRTFDPYQEEIYVTLSENALKQKQEKAVPDDRLNESKSAIVALERKQAETAKKLRLLNEQVISIRTHIRQITPKGKQ
jgi:septal ring factor EnvC (AmiA/AmiB activator)